MGERAEEHDKSITKRDSKSALSEHQEKTGHVVTTKPLIKSIKIIDTEPKDKHRKIIEAINIMISRDLASTGMTARTSWSCTSPCSRRRRGPEGGDTDQLLIP